MRLRLLVSEAWRSLGANLSTTFAATMTVLVGMFLLGLFIALGTWTLSWSNHVKRELIVKVYFRTTPTARPATRAGDRRVVRVSSRRTRRCKSVQVRLEGGGARADEEALPGADEDLPYNPLPDSFEVHADEGRGHRATIADEPATAAAGRREGRTTARRLSNRVLQVAHVIEAIFIDRDASILLVAVDAADREHDPALDLLAAA